MFRIRFIFFSILALLVFSGTASHGGSSIEEIELEAVYKRDIVDYDENEKSLYRERVRVRFSELSSFNFCHQYINNNEGMYTWNLILFDIARNYRFILGNYNANFGTGLLMGKKKYIPPDQFVSSMAVSRSEPFQPENSGNPIYSFNGIAGLWNYPMGSMEISINIFYSTRRRYISMDDYDNGFAGSNLNSINAKIEKDISHPEPVSINDIGFMTGIKYGKYFSIQAYAFQTEIMGTGRENISWDYYSDNTGIGLHRFYGYGCFSQYSDDYSLIFFELGMSRREFRPGENAEELSMDYGFLCGFKFQFPLFFLSMAWKQTGINYYSLYSSGKNYPEKLFEFESSLKLYDPVTAGAVLSSEKRITPGRYDYLLPLIIREGIFFKYGISRKEKAAFYLTKISYENDKGRSLKWQIKGDANKYVVDNFELEFSGLCQWSEYSGYSRNFGGGFFLHFLDNLNIRMKYERLTIINGNTIYSRGKYDPESISDGSVENQTTGKISAMLEFRYKKDHLFVRYLSYLSGKRSYRERIELGGKVVL